MSNTLTPEQVAAAAYAAGFRGSALVQAVQVAYSESDWAPTAHNSCCYGLWQINLNAHSMSGDWKNPIDNAREAYKIYSAAGDSFCNTGTPGQESCNPWQSYGNKRYDSVSSQAQMAVAQLNQDLAAGKTAEEIVGQGGSGGASTTPPPGSSTTAGLTSFMTNILNPHWWKRIGAGALGALVILGALYFALPKQSGSFKLAKKVVSTE